MESSMVIFLISTGLVLGFYIAYRIFQAQLRDRRHYPPPYHMSQGYYPPHYPPPYYPPSSGWEREEYEEGRGISSTLIFLIILGALFWLMVVRNHFFDGEAPAPPPVQENVPPPTREPPSANVMEPGNPSPPQAENTGPETYEPERRPVGNEVVRNPLPEDEPIESFHAIQLGAFRSLDNAREIALSYEHFSKGVEIVRHGDHYKVIMGPFPDSRSATAYRDRHQLEGFVEFFEIIGL